MNYTYFEVSPDVEKEDTHSNLFDWENVNLLPLGRRANTIPLPPRAVTKNPALITDKTARPLALAITLAENKY